jgi:acyl-ACP thioesterase
MQKVIDTLTLNQTVGSGDCDFTKSLTLSSLTRGMQEAAYLHAKSLNLDAENICEGTYHWVLTRLSIQIEEALPCWNDQWEIQTWITGQDKLFAYREFAFHSQGKYFGRASSTWLLIDAESRRPAPPEKAFSCVDLDFPPEEERSDARRIRAAEVYSQTLANPITYDHIDLHNHVNNTKYFGFFLKLFPRSFLRPIGSKSSTSTSAPSCNGEMKPSLNWKPMEPKNRAAQLSSTEFSIRGAKFLPWERACGPG